MENDEYWESIDMQGKTFIQEKVNKIDSYKTIGVCRQWPATCGGRGARMDGTATHAAGVYSAGVLELVAHARPRPDVRRDCGRARCVMEDRGQCGQARGREGGCARAARVSTGRRLAWRLLRQSR